MELKTVTLTELDAVVGLMIKYFEFYDRKIPSDDALRDHSARFLGGNEFGVQFICCDENVSVGFATLYFTYSTLSLMPISVMNDLYIEPEFRGKGIADMLFDKCVEYSKSKGISKMEWVTANDNIRAKKFYDKKGGKGSEWTLYDYYF